MNLLNAGLQTVATSLVALGGTSLSSGFNWGGVVLCVLGLAVYLVYELTPVKSSPAPTA